MIFNTHTFLDEEFFGLGFKWANATAAEKPDVLYNVSAVAQCSVCWMKMSEQQITLSLVTVGHRDIFDINVPPFILKF